MRKILLIISLIPFLLFSQKSLFNHNNKFTHQDTLRGSITPERSWWDLKHYNLSLEIFPETKNIKGSNIITFQVLKSAKKMQIDLQEPLKIKKIEFKKTQLNFEREGNVYWVYFPENLVKNSVEKIKIYYLGKPTESKNPPWSGGITWKKDENNYNFIASSNQGIGASIWWPNKDHSYDEPDNGIDMYITVPQELTDVSNGRLINIKHNKKSKTKTFHWRVKNPINNYGVNINIGNYVNFNEKYQGENGLLDCSYWVLKQNLYKAKKQFKQASMTIKAFEYWFGPYPFYEDSYKLVEAPYLGMEHQSSVTYGNKFQNGYLGTDLSGTGVGLKFDFIIVHETGHEWFANSITNKDVADMWIHESFTTYSESLFIDYHFSTEEANKYVIGMRKSIKNDKPIIGQYNVNNEGSSDMYYKGSNILHTLRQIINNDNLWREILRGLNLEFFHKQVTTEEIEKYILKKGKLNINGFFDQYLRTTKIPIFEYKIESNKLKFRFTNTVEGFNMPIKVKINNISRYINVSNNHSILEIKNQSIKSFSVNKNYYINQKKL